MDDIAQVIRRHFGFDALRAGQRRAIEALLDGRDTLAVMPTGYGKSAIYQIAALLVDGPTVVVSPLIALQADQATAITDDDIADAAALNSQLTDAQRARLLGDLAGDDLEFVLLAPEQLGRDDTLEALAAAGVSLFVVDEAHCISAWGHDFRPDYLRLGAVADRLGRPTVLALTATAAPPVRDEIVTRLRMRDADVVVTGFDRPNIALEVRLFDDEDRKLAAVVEAAATAPTPGLVYAATRREVDEIAESLRSRGVAARGYHAGRSGNERDEVQDAFMAGHVDVVVATVAFGMGIDKADVRFVHHADVPDSLDSYYQEIGRAGRDGQPAEALLFYRPQDVGLRRFFAASGRVDDEAIGEVADALDDRDGATDVGALADATDLSAPKVTAAVQSLEDSGGARIAASGEVTADDPGAAVDDAAASEQARQRLEQSRVTAMREYAETTGCRRHFLLSYFGEAYEPPCDACDNCRAGLVDAGAAADQPYAVGSRVRHPEWGTGRVLRYEGDRVAVLFDEVGYKTLLLDVVAERDLLAFAPS